MIDTPKTRNIIFMVKKQKNNIKLVDQVSVTLKHPTNY